MEHGGRRIPDAAAALETRTPKRQDNFALVTDLGVSDLTNGHGKYLHLHTARISAREALAEKAQGAGERSRWDF
jgi:hypothetical protein